VKCKEEADMLEEKREAQQNIFGQMEMKNAKMLENKRCCMKYIQSIDI
jgi:hypothetical protein